MPESSTVPAIQAESIDKVFGNDADRVVALNRVSVAIDPPSTTPPNKNSSPASEANKRP